MPTRKLLFTSNPPENYELNLKLKGLVGVPPPLEEPVLESMIPVKPHPF